MKIKLCGFWVCVFLMAACGSDAQNKENSFSAVFVLGKATVNGKQIQRGDAIPFQAVLETGFGGVLEFSVGEKNIYRLSENARLEISIEKEVPDFYLAQGQMTGLSRQSFSAKKQYVIRTPAISAEVQGASFFVWSENSHHTYFCVCNGVMNLKSLDSSAVSERISAHRHAGRRFSRFGEETEIDRNPGMLYHSDEDLENLAIKISEKINWNEAYRH